MSVCALIITKHKNSAINNRGDLIKSVLGKLYHIISSLLIGQHSRDVQGKFAINNNILILS